MLRRLLKPFLGNTTEDFPSTDVQDMIFTSNPEPEPEEPPVTKKLINIDNIWNEYCIN